MFQRNSRHRETPPPPMTIEVRLAAPEPSPGRDWKTLGTVMLWLTIGAGAAGYLLAQGDVTVILSP
jgi:hypothetical protein